MSRIARAMAATAAMLAWAIGAGAGSAGAAGITNGGSDLRDGWYANQPALSPDAVSSGSFGQIWRAPVDGQVYAQPLVVGATVVVATERNQVYAFDSDTGATKWTRDLGPPYPANLVGCGDLYPDLGVTGTPVIDTATNTIYLTHKTYDSGTSGPAAWYMDALDATTGQERAHFPKQLTGAAQNAPDLTFNPTAELQRPGLLLLDGVVYAGFGGHCDIPPYQGWVLGVDAATATIKARWSAVTSRSGAGIWQSGSGLMSDGPGRIFLSTGNGGSPQPPLAAPGAGMYGESVVRLAVQPDGTLKPMDFFAPFDAAHLDDYDADFASGGVTALRDDAFGTSRFPHVGIAVGKAGYVYLLNRDDLGGIGNGEPSGDRVISRDGPYGGVWSRPGVWPGDGGWISIPTASPSAGDNPEASGSSGHLMLYRYRVSADGVPSLDAPVESDDAFGFGSSAPVITSDGMTSGSAVMWVIWSPDGWGAGAQLRAYDAVPVNGHLNLRRSWPIGQTSKFGTPGVGNGRIYVGTRDGHVLGFGAPVAAPVRAAATTFPVTTVGQTSTKSVTLTIAGTVSISSITAGGAFAARTGGAGVPGTFTPGSTVTVPVDFTPTQPGAAGGTLTVTTDKGPFTFSLSGTGQAQDALLTASPTLLSFAGATVGDVRSGSVTLGNGGGQPLTVTRIDAPSAPFSIAGGPQPGAVITPGAAANVSVRYAPTAAGTFNDELTIVTSAGTEVIGLTGTAGFGPDLALTPAGGWDFGTVVVGQSTTRSVTVANTGDSTMTITKSKPPAAPGLTVAGGLDEGTTIAPGASRTLQITWMPTAPGTLSGLNWMINAGDGSGVHDVTLNGTAVAPTDDAEPATNPDAGSADAGAAAAAGPPALAPALQPPGVVVAQGPVLPERVRPDLSVSHLRPSRDGRRLAVSGRVTAAATGPLGVTLSARVGRRSVTVVTSAQLRGRPTYAFTLTLPRAARSWKRVQVTVRFAGSSRVWPGAGSVVLLRAR